MKLSFSLLLLLITGNAFASHYQKIVTRLQELGQLPNTSLFTLGHNDQGQEILGIALGDLSSARVRHLVVGTHHGNERAAAEVPLYFVPQMLSTLKPDEAIYVIPVLNISGYDRVRREEMGADGRFRDSNRDYEDPCVTKSDFQLKSTTLLAEFVERENIIATVTVHGYVGTFTFPWGTTTTNYETMDHAFMEKLAREATKENRYKTGTHGGAIYPASGAFEDWAYYKHGVWSYLLEIKSPVSDLKKDAQSLVEFFKSAPTERSLHVGQQVNCVERILSGLDRSRP